MLDPARQQRQGGLDPVFRYHPYGPRRRPAGDHRPRRFIAFFSALISKGNTRLAYRDRAGPEITPISRAIMRCASVHEALHAHDEPPPLWLRRLPGHAQSRHGNVLNG